MGFRLYRDWPSWWFCQPRYTWPSHWLLPLAHVYAHLAAQRLRRKAYHPGVPVIAVGNFTLGGGGKTPLVRWLRALADRQGYKTAVLLRGYGGGASGQTAIVSDDRHHTSAELGDEAMIHQLDGLTVVGRDRLASAHLAMAEGANLLLMDDGVQSRWLEADMTLMAIDAVRGFGNGHVLPAGPLRAPLKAYEHRVDALVVFGASNQGDGLQWPDNLAGVPRFSGRFALSPDSVSKLKGQRVLAFAGIANPDKFFTSLKRSGIDVVVQCGFADHRPLSESEAKRLLEISEKHGLQLVTTLKDAMRFDQVKTNQRTSLSVLVEKTLIIDGACVIHQPFGDFEKFILSKITEAHSPEPEN